MLRSAAPRVRQPGSSRLFSCRRCSRGRLLGVVLAAELRRLGLSLVSGFLQDRRDLGVGDEVLPALGIPVEEHPDPVVLVGVAKDRRTLGTVLLSLLGALGREDFRKRSKSSTFVVARIISLLLCCPPRRRSTPMIQRVYAPQTLAGPRSRDAVDTRNTTTDTSRAGDRALATPSGTPRARSARRRLARVPQDERPSRPARLPATGGRGHRGPTGAILEPGGTVAAGTPSRSTPCAAIRLQNRTGRVDGVDR